MSKEEIFNLVKSKPQSYLIESCFSKKFHEIYLEYLKWDIPNEGKNWKFKQKLWHFLQDDLELKLGLCTVCGKRCKLIRFNLGYRVFCSLKCSNGSQIHKDKNKKTCLNLYGDENYNNREKSKQTKLKNFGDENYNNREKAKQTCKDKYNMEFYSQSVESHERMKELWECKSREEHKYKSIEGCLKKHGVENYAQSQEYKDRYYFKYLPKYKDTCLKLFNSENYTTSDDYKEHKDEYIKKREETCLEKYNETSYAKTQEFKDNLKLVYNIKYMCDSYFQTNEFKIKSYNTKKKNHTFNTSYIEEEIYNYFIKNNIKIIRQYKSDLYPFLCDFYLPDYDLYIEIQGNWTHGRHPFDENNQDDINILNMWKEKSKNSLYYINAIEVWTKRDVKKRNISKQNNLNYLEIFSDNIETCIFEIEKRIG